MKKVCTGLIIFVLLLVAAVFVPLQAQAAGETDLKFTLNEDGTSYSVSDYWGYGATEITIPSTYNGLPVTGIGSYAFAYASGLKTIVIPEGVTLIENNAFIYCRDLETISIPSSLLSIGINVFNQCEKLQYTEKDNVKYLGNNNNPYVYCVGVSSYQYTEINIAKGSKIIGAFAFEDCSSLVSINIPEGVQQIGKSAFEGCTKLYHVVFPSSLLLIDEAAFSGCKLLDRVIIPDSVKSIGKNAFSSCSGMTGLRIGNGVQDIGEYAFSGCGLHTILLPKTLHTIGTGAFNRCAAIKKLYYKGTQADWNNLVVGQNNDNLVNANITYGYTEDHVWDEGYVTRQPTCGEEGKRQCMCVICDRVGEVAIPKLTTHTWGGGEMTKEATCVETGLWTVSCTRCGEKKTTELSVTSYHTWNQGTVIEEASCTKEGSVSYTCIHCGEQQITATQKAAHKMTGWNQVTAPTCVENGVQARICTVCGTEEVAPINPLGHSFVNSCDTECDVCGEVRTISHSLTDWQQSAETHGQMCSVCGELQNMGGHVFEPEENGKTCSICGYYVENTALKAENLIVLFVIVAAVAGALAGGAIVAIVLRGKKKE